MGSLSVGLSGASWRGLEGDLQNVLDRSSVLLIQVSLLPQHHAASVNMVLKSVTAIS